MSNHNNRRFTPAVESLEGRTLMSAAPVGGTVTFTYRVTNPGAPPVVEALRVETSGPSDAGFAGGVRVATGDVNGDGATGGCGDIVTGSGLAAPHVKVFSGTTGI